MMNKGIIKDKSSLSAGAAVATFSSNSIRLSGREWVFVGIALAVLLHFGPALWEMIESFEQGTDYRLPYELSNDYWLYKRYCRWACRRYDAIVIGDSVIWGHYVPRDATLPHYLNEAPDQEQFANLGVDGIHPAALAGLIRYYGRAISDKQVILHFNPLWMSSKKHDLQIEKEFRFNHPKLVAQFRPRIPCYKESFSKRLSVVVQRHLPFFIWIRHLRLVYFNGMDISAWTLSHPYKNPFGAIILKPSVLEDKEVYEQKSWIQQGIVKRDIAWVESATSLQWMFFQQTVELLQARGNTLFVLVGPFNEYMLQAESIETYEQIKTDIESWLWKKGTAYYILPILPSEFYRDASHPLAEGYEMLAEEIIENPSFRSTVR
jgi:hypothetical protein